MASGTKIHFVFFFYSFYFSPKTFKVEKHIKRTNRNRHRIKKKTTVQLPTDLSFVNLGFVFLIFEYYLIDGFGTRKTFKS